jgi:hypothetical protein
MQTTATTRNVRVAVLVLTALMIAATVFTFASAITATDAHAGVRVGSSPTTREST